MKVVEIKFSILLILKNVFIIGKIIYVLKKEFLRVSLFSLRIFDYENL